MTKKFQREKKGKIKLDRAVCFITSWPISGLIKSIWAPPQFEEFLRFLPWLITLSPLFRWRRLKGWHHPASSSKETDWFISVLARSVTAGCFHHTLWPTIKITTFSHIPSDHLQMLLYLLRQWCLFLLKWQQFSKPCFSIVLIFRKEKWESCHDIKV